MDRTIDAAAVQGNVILLRKLLDEDPLILDKIMADCKPETPSHTAAMLGHAEFVQEILNLKPELAGELDRWKRSALHLATARGYLVIVKNLISVAPETCFLCDRDGLNPLHVAAIKGRLDVLRELFVVRPQAARVLVDQSGETILHLCVKFNQLEAMKFLVETMDDHDQLVNSKNTDGKTILDMEVDDPQVEAIKYLTTSGRVKVNDLDAHVFKALAALTQSSRGVKDRDIGGEVLRATSAKDDRHLSAHDQLGTQTSSVKSYEDKQSSTGSKILNRHHGWFEKWFAFKVAASLLIATTVFQVGFSPFVASLIIILLLISGSPFISRFLMWVFTVIMSIAATAIVLAYMISASGVTTSVALALAAPIIMLIWIGSIALLLLGHVVRLVIKILKHLGTLIWRHRK